MRCSIHPDFFSFCRPEIELLTTKILILIADVSQFFFWLHLLHIFCVPFDQWKLAHDISSHYHVAYYIHSYILEFNTVILIFWYLFGDLRLASAHFCSWSVFFFVQVENSSLGMGLIGELMYIFKCKIFLVWLMIAAPVLLLRRFVFAILKLNRVWYLFWNS